MERRILAVPVLRLVKVTVERDSWDEVRLRAP